MNSFVALYYVWDMLYEGSLWIRLIDLSYSSSMFTYTGSRMIAPNINEVIQKEMVEI